MTGATIIVGVENSGINLNDTLESLVEQTDENFEVIISLSGRDKDAEKTADEYIEKYVGFYKTEVPGGDICTLWNKPISSAKGEYLIFLESGDRLSDESVENILKTAKELDSDLITGRKFNYGDIEYEYDTDYDRLAIMKKISRLEPFLLKMRDAGCFAVRKKTVDLNNLRFEKLPDYSARLFFMASVMKSKIISGCPDFICEKRNFPVSEPLSSKDEPTLEKLSSLEYVSDEIRKLAREEIFLETGQVEGDEEFLQEILFASLETLVKDFYLFIWYENDELVMKTAEEFKKFSENADKSMIKRFCEKYRELRMPVLYASKEDAAKEPLFSIIFDITDENQYLPFLRSLYRGQYPFFELLVNESRYENFPDEFKNMANIRVLPDRTFHFDANRTALSKYRLDIKNGAPLDKRVLKETCLSSVPSFLVKAVFSQKRTSLSMRKDLKDKGLIMADRDGS